MVANVVEVFGSRIAEGNDVQAGGQAIQKQNIVPHMLSRGGYERKKNEFDRKKKYCFIHLHHQCLMSVLQKLH